MPGFLFVDFGRLPHPLSAGHPAHAAAKAWNQRRPIPNGDAANSQSFLTNIAPATITLR
jgi:hypothetical protein